MALSTNPHNDLLPVPDGISRIENQNQWGKYVLNAGCPATKGRIIPWAHKNRGLDFEHYSLNNYR
jgi:hypothetical protein